MAIKYLNLSMYCSLDQNQNCQEKSQLHWFRLEYAKMANIYNQYPRISSKYMHPLWINHAEICINKYVNAQKFATICRIYA